MIYIYIYIPYATKAASKGLFINWQGENHGRCPGHIINGAKQYAASIGHTATRQMEKIGQGDLR